MLKFKYLVIKNHIPDQVLTLIGKFLDRTPSKSDSFSLKAYLADKVYDLHAANHENTFEMLELMSLEERDWAYKVWGVHIEEPWCDCGCHLGTVLPCGTWSRTCLYDIDF